MSNDSLPHFYTTFHYLAYVARWSPTTSYYFLSFKNKIIWGTTLPHKKCGEKLYKKVAMNHYSIYISINSLNSFVSSKSLSLAHLFDQFLNFCVYFCTVVFLYGIIVEEPTTFPVLGSLILSSFRIRSGKDLPL
jgi:hypothetical protein